MYKERCRRGISEQKISRGVCTRTELRKMENGDIPWKKMIGDYLLQRLGVPTEYFEVMADARELNGWRDREDICLIIFEQPQKAQQLLETYQKKYRKKTPFEEQFLRKMQTILLMQAYKKSFESKSVDVEREKSEGENLVESAQQTVLCTLPDGWEKKKLSKFLLAPCELESILLLANCLLLIGKTDEAMQMHKKVADYVKQAKFEPKVQILIYPQVALLGMKLELYAGNEEKAFSYGMEALELLRHQYSQRYVVFVLEELLNVLECISVKGKEDQKYKEEETEVTEFLKTFEELYRLFSHPKKRMWQSISVSNTHEIGLTLKMLRKAMGLSAAKVSAANPDHLTARQIEKIEAGTHRPSGRNYEMLMQFYHKTGLEGQLLLETDSLEVLHQRQEIVDFIIREEWDNAWESFQSFKEKLDVNVPLNRQEVLFMESNILYKREKLASDEYLRMLKEALSCTMPELPLEKWNMWVFQREEGSLAGNIAYMLEVLGEREQAEELYQALIQSFDMQMKHTKIPYRGYTIVSEGLENVLGNLGKYAESMQQDKMSIEVLMNDTCIDPLDYPLYDLCWCLYQLDDRKMEDEKKEENQYGVYFRLCYYMAKFCYKSGMVKFLEERMDKYLNVSGR